MSMPIGAIIFDFGGVLVRTTDTSGRQKWEAKFGLPRGGLDEVVFDSEAAARATVGQLPEAAVWQHVADSFELNERQLKDFQRDFWAGDWLDPELIDFLRQLRPRYKTAILSNAWSGARRTFTETFGLGQVVDTMVISAEEGLAKPDPRIYHLTVERLGLRPEEAVFVDDMAVNVAAAQEVGLRGVQFKSTRQVLADVQRHLDRTGSQA
jgi:epoxide hydrolase-like predicted phosphatase